MAYEPPQWVTPAPGVCLCHVASLGPCMPPPPSFATLPIVCTRSFSTFDTHFLFLLSHVCLGEESLASARWMYSLHGFLHGIECIMFHGHLDYIQEPPLGGRPNTKPGDYGTPNAHNRWFILLYHVGGPAWIEIHWNSIWSRARSHTASNYTWESVTKLHDFGGVLGRRPLDTFFWALTISWSRLLAHVWSGP